ncbi:uncharacterized protein LOC144310237 [Canis aureus]
MKGTRRRLEGRKDKMELSTFEFLIHILMGHRLQKKKFLPLPMSRLFCDTCHCYDFASSSIKRTLVLLALWTFELRLELIPWSSNYQAFGLRLKYTTDFPGSPAFRWQIMGLLSLHDHVNPGTFSLQWHEFKRGNRTAQILYQASGPMNQSKSQESEKLC